jgi:hypothetical protein
MDDDVGWMNDDNVGFDADVDRQQCVVVVEDVVIVIVVVVANWDVR